MDGLLAQALNSHTVLGKTTITSGFYRGQRNFKVYITEQTNTNKQTEDKQIIQLNYGKIPKGKFQVFLKSAVQKVVSDCTVTETTVTYIETYYFHNLRTVLSWEWLNFKQIKGQSGKNRV